MIMIISRRGARVCGIQRWELCQWRWRHWISAKDESSFKAVGNPRREKNNSIVRISTLYYCCVQLPGGGGFSIYPWMGRCGAAPHTLTLFKTSIADFPTLFKTEFRFLIPCLRHLINIRTCKNFAVYRPRKDILFKTKNDKFDTLFKTKIPKNIPWLAARPIKSL